jgi:transcriptional regulator with XRE-family HTH domain
MDSTFGARLRQQREERQVTLTTISARSKIKMSLLEQLENDDLSAWPKGLFGRAYLRDYATAVGLDPETLVSEFLALYPEFAYVTPEVEEAEARADAARSGPAQKFRRFVSSAFSSRSPRMAMTPPPRQAPDRLQFDDPADAAPAPLGDVDPELLVGASIPHMIAEAEERPRIPFAELEAREELLDQPEEDFDATEEPNEDIVALPAPVVPEVPLRTPSTREISLSAIAEVCTRLARAIDFREVTTLLSDAARLLDAVGVIVWQWDARATALRPSLACGYPDAIVARLPGVRSDDPNAVATAFRSGEQCIVDGADGTEAIVVPSLGVGGCVGVLAVELRPGCRERESICAFTNILAAQLATLLPAPEPVEA